MLIISFLIVINALLQPKKSRNYINGHFVKANLFECFF